MKKKVAFICVHNSCRSQMAEAIGNHLYGDYLECYSAGTELKDQINQDAVRIVKELYVPHAEVVTCKFQKDANLGGHCNVF